MEVYTLKMSTQVTLTLPDSVYRQVESMAQATNRPLTEVLSETIHQAFPPLHVHEKRASMQQEVAAFEANHTDLWQQYPHQFVALYQKQVIDHDDDELALVERIEARYPDEVILIRQVLPHRPEPLRFRSPRFVNR